MKLNHIYFWQFYLWFMFAALAQLLECLPPLVQWVQDSIPGKVKNFVMKILNLRTRKSGDTLFLIDGLYINVLD